MANEVRLIDANALMTFVSGYVDEPDYQHTGEDWRNGAWAVGYEISIAPTVDAVEVVHAEWVDAYGIRNSKCTNCGVAFCRVMNGDCFYCPNCGAKMDGGNKDG